MLSVAPSPFSKTDWRQSAAPVSRARKTTPEPVLDCSSVTATTPPSSSTGADPLLPACSVRQRTWGVPSGPAASRRSASSETT